MIEKAAILLIITLLGFPIGRFIAARTKDEIDHGKAWFMLVLLISSAVVVCGTTFSDPSTQLLITSSFGFISMLALAALKEER